MRFTSLLIPNCKKKKKPFSPVLEGFSGLSQPLYGQTGILGGFRRVLDTFQLVRQAKTVC